MIERSRKVRLAKKRPNYPSAAALMGFEIIGTFEVTPLQPLSKVSLWPCI